MSKKKLTITVKLPKQRNPYAVSASSRKAGVMHDRRAPRGGSKNESRTFTEEYEQSDSDDEE